MKKTLLIVDGMNLHFQMFFGMPNKIFNDKGKAIHGSIGFIGALNKIIKMTGATHAVVLFDSEHQNNRSDLLPEYKANRPDFSEVADEDNPFTQLEDVYKCLDVMGIKHAEVKDYETDDVISLYVNTYKEDDIDIYVSSFDSDFFQLIDDNVKIIRYRGKNTVFCDRTYIKEKLDICPEDYAHFKCLTGDTSDNIKGANKIGPKTAAKLINKFKTVDNLIENAEQIESPCVRSSVIEAAERLKLNLKLIELGTVGKMPFCLEEIKYDHMGTPTLEILKKAGLR